MISGSVANAHGQLPLFRPPLSVPMDANVSFGLRSGFVVSGAALTIPQVIQTPNGPYPPGTYQPGPVSPGSVGAPGGGAVKGDLSAVVAYAYAGLGSTYVWGGTSRTEGWDCSGFVQWAYRQAGIDLPRTEQWVGMTRTTTPSPGDLVTQRPDGVNHWAHVGIYIGNSMMISALNPMQGTILHSVGPVGTSTYFTTNIAAGPRIDAADGPKNVGMPTARGTERQPAQSLSVTQQRTTKPSAEGSKPAPRQPVKPTPHAPKDEVPKAPTLSPSKATRAPVYPTAPADPAPPAGPTLPAGPTAPVNPTAPADPTPPAGPTPPLLGQPNADPAPVDPEPVDPEAAPADPPSVPVDPEAAPVDPAPAPVDPPSTPTDPPVVPDPSPINIASIMLAAAEAQLGGTQTAGELISSVLASAGIVSPGLLEQVSALGSMIQPAEVLPGDLLYYGPGSQRNSLMAIYAGGGMVVHGDFKGSGTVKVAAELESLPTIIRISTAGVSPS